MKISLIILVTLFTLTAWGLGLSQMPANLRIPVIAGSLIAIFLRVIIAAFNSQSNVSEAEVSS